MNTLLFLLLDGTPAAGAAGKNGAQIWIMLGLMIVVFYFFMIRPQNKRQKELKNFRESLKEGDKVVTSGGIHGKVAQIKDGAILVEVDNNVRIKFDKNSILSAAEANKQQEQPAAK